MNEDNKNAYSEVIEILKWIDDEQKLEALPMEMLELLKSKANPEYKPELSKEVPLEEQNLQPETLQILSWIAMKYWSNDINSSEENNEQEKETTPELAAETNLAQNIETQEFNKVEEVKEPQSALPVLYSDLKWYQKLKIKIIKFFNTLFRKNNVEEENKEEGQVL